MITMTEAALHMTLMCRAAIIRHR